MAPRMSNCTQAALKFPSQLAICPQLADSVMFNVSIRFEVNAVFAAALLLATSSAWASDNKSIQGRLIGEDGKAWAGVEIRAQRTDVKAKPAVTRTDSQGVYVFKGLPAGKYNVIAYVGGFPKSKAKVQTRDKGWARVDFDLRLNDANNEDVDRMQRDLSNSGPLP